jgi:hypothetical protein
LREERPGAQPCCGNFKRDPRPQARLLEKQRHRSIAQKMPLLAFGPALEECREAQQPEQLRGVEVGYFKEGTAGEPGKPAGGWREGIHVLYIYAYVG